MFSESYIKKCKQEDIQREIEGLMIDSRRVVFVKGDSFYHEEMGNKELEIVSDVLGTYADKVIGDDNMIDFPTEKCFLIPTFEELKEALNICGKNYGQNELSDGDEEELLDRIIEEKK